MSSAVWRQFIVVSGEPLQLLESKSNIAAARRNPESNTLIIKGDGVWFPEVKGASWVAGCRARLADDVPADDIYPLLRVLLDGTPMLTSDAPREEIAAWLRGDAR